MYTITVVCTGCAVNATQTISDVTFGDVWLCSGQSNMWLPVQNTFSRNDTVKAIQAGKYGNIRVMDGNSGTKPNNVWPPKYGMPGGSNPWKSAPQALEGGSWDKNNFPLFQFGASCWYFAQNLVDLGVNIPIGLTDTAIGGQRIEEYARWRGGGEVNLSDIGQEG